MGKDVLLGTGFIFLIYLLFRFRRKYWLVVLKIVAFALGYHFGLRWIEWLRTLGSRDWLSVFDQTPITARGAITGVSFFFGIAAMRALENLILPPFLPPSSREPSGGAHDQ